MPTQPDLFAPRLTASAAMSAAAFVEWLRAFEWEGRQTVVSQFESASVAAAVPVLTNEYWTSRQRAAHSLH